MKIILLIFFGVLIASTCAQTKPSFTIMAPNILCSKVLRNPQTLTIRLIPTEAQKLNYHIVVNYEYSIPQRNQQHSLRIWQTIRLLEQQFGRNRISINADNKIDIATSMLTPGVLYTFEIQAEDESGSLSDVQRYYLDYKEGNLYRMCQEDDQAGEFSMDEIIENLSAKEHSSIKVIGPTETYANLPIILDAKIKFIGHPNEYFIKWTIFNHNSSATETFKGSHLQISPFELEPGREYTIQAELNDAGNSDRVAVTNHTIKIKFHPLIVDLEPSEVLAGPGRLLQFEVHVKDLNREKPVTKVEWRCVAQQTESLCNEFPPPTGEKVALAFVKPGKYQLQAIVVNQDNFTDMETALIEIQPDIVARAKVISLPPHPSDISKWIKAQVQIEYVVPKCTAKWEIVEHEGYAYTDLKPMGGNIGGIVVHDFESNFLVDLADFTNKTVSKLVNLKIPPPNYYPNWKGLIGDAKYKLRLQIECPAPSNPDVSETVLTPQTVKSYLDIDVDTNSPPSNHTLFVTPSDGVALSTQFKFRVLDTVDKDKPLRFSYGFELGNTSVVLEEGFEIKSVESTLPAGEIHTFSNVCDIYKACSKVYGPIIKLQLPNLTFEVLRKEIDMIESDLDRMEYEKAINQVFMYGMTLKEGDMKLYEEFYTNVLQLLKAETKRLLAFPELLSNDQRFVFIKNSRQILEILDIRDNEIIRDLMALLEMIVDQEDIQIARDIKRRKRQALESRSVVIEVEDVLETFKNLIDRLKPDDNAVFPIADEMLRWLCIQSNVTDVIRFNYSIQILKTETLDTAFHFNNGPTIYLRGHSDNNTEYCIGLVYDDKTNFDTAIYQVVVASRSNTKHNLYSTTDIQQIEIEYLTNMASNCLILNQEWKTCPSSQNETTLHCSCGFNVPFRIQSDGKEIPFTTPQPKLTSTVIQTTSKNDLPTVQTTSTVMPEVRTTVTSSATLEIRTSTTSPITITGTTQSEVVTVKTTPSNTPANHDSIAIETNKTEAVLIPDRTGATIEEQTTTNFAAAVGYTALSVLGIGVALGVVSYYLYRHNQAKTNSFALDLQAIAAEARAQIPGIRYSRFHDESTMRGDSNVYTMG